MTRNPIRPRYPARMHFRLADDHDDDALWRIIEPTVRAGETWALPRDWTREAALAYWRAPSLETWVADRGTPDGTPDARDVVGTYFLRPAQLGPGSHLGNGGYMVRPDAWGKGVAGAMCDHSIQRARERGFVAIQFNFVVSTNARAVALWERKGFRVIGRSPGAYMHATLGAVDSLMMHRTV
jgi:GNAT superfamily N-acetyltransferase